METDVKLYALMVAIQKKVNIDDALYIMKVIDKQEYVKRKHQMVQEVINMHNDGRRLVDIASDMDTSASNANHIIKRNINKGE